MTSLQLESLRPRLREFYKENEVDVWLLTRQKLLGWKAPCDCAFEEVDRIVAQLEDGAYI